MNPLDVPCPKCHVPAGQKCKNYRGQNKQTCPDRGQPAPKPKAAPAQQQLLFQQPTEETYGS